MTLWRMCAFVFLLAMIPQRISRVRHPSPTRRPAQPEQVRFHKIDERTSKECAICRRSGADYEHTCGVFFHKSCIEQYFDAISIVDETERICPHCQAPVPLDLDEEEDLSIEVSPISDEVYDQYLNLSDDFSLALIDGNIRDVSVFLNSPSGEQYFVSVDFAYYPKKPTFSFPDDLLAHLAGLDELLERLNSWDEEYPLKLADIFNDIQQRIRPDENVRRPAEGKEEEEVESEDRAAAKRETEPDMEPKSPDSGQGPEEGVVEVYPEEEVVEVSPEERDGGPVEAEEILPAAFFETSYLDEYPGSGGKDSEDAFENEEAISQYLELSNSFSMEMVDNRMYHVVAYLSCLDAGIYNIYPVRVNFMDYPQKPMLTLTDDFLIRIRGLNEIMKGLGQWDPTSPKGIVDILQDLEMRLVADSNIESEFEVIKREYKSARISKNRFIITIPTYGPKFYDIELDLSDYPQPPKVIIPEELDAIAPEDLDAIRKWPEKPQKRIMDVLRSLQQTINYLRRPAFEESLLSMIAQDFEVLDGGYRVAIDIPRFSENGEIEDSPPTSKMHITISVPNAYPLAPPEFYVDVDDENIRSMVQLFLSEISRNWAPSFFLADGLNRMSLSLANISLFPCLICGQKACPTCGKSLMMAYSGHTEGICEKPCIHCKRPYHIHCISETLNSGVGECGFCLTDLSRYF